MAAWSILKTDEFEEWYTQLDGDAKGDIYAAMLVLSEIGPSLGRPRVDSLFGSKHANMKELRVQSNGRPFRIFFAFDPTRNAVLLCGGDKTGDKRFYEVMIKQADELYDSHLKELNDEKAKKKGTHIGKKKGK
jgi:hypothetical protein